MAEKLSITLPSEMVSIIKERVREGTYASTSEVLREAVRTWLRQENEYEARMESIKARINRSLDDPRPNLSGKQVRENLDALYAVISKH